MPFAIVVVANGRLCRSLTCRSNSGLAIRMAEEPSTAIGRFALAVSSPAAGIAASGGGADLRRRFPPRRVFPRRRQRHVLRQIEMHRPERFAERNADRLVDGLGDL